jgi:hypothetical protein
MQAALADEQDHLGGAANAGAKDDAAVKLRKAGITSAVSIFMKSSGCLNGEIACDIK